MDSRFDGIVSDAPSNSKKEEQWLTQEGNEVKKLIKVIEGNTQTMDKQIKAIMTEVNATVMEKKNKAIMETISSTQDVINKAKSKLDTMADTNKSLGQTNTAVMRENMHRSLTKQLIDTGTHFSLTNNNKKYYIYFIFPQKKRRRQKTLLYLNTLFFN